MSRRYSASGWRSGAASAKPEGTSGRLGRKEAREGREFDPEAARVGELRHEAEIGERRCIPEAERPGLAGEQHFASREPITID